ncbi:MAG: hypothetical protein MUF22_05510 [Chitinispirillaceae bacterium]|nr:hypothetical protein [Chitinispirillaceae bacterium]
MRLYAIMMNRNAASVAKNFFMQKVSAPKSYFSSLIRFSASPRSLQILQICCIGRSRSVT